MTKNLKVNEVFDYQAFFQSIKNRVSTARINFSRQANREANALYWFIGKAIVDNQKKQGWGKAVVATLSRDLKRYFPDIKFGFSPQNLWYMRQIYLEYKKLPNLQRLIGEIGWGSNLEIMSKVKDLAAREYYLRAVIEMGWTRNILSLQIQSQAYERQCLEGKTHNFEKALPKHLAEQADKSLKSVYSLEALGFAKPVVENELRRRMVARIKDVLLEFGSGFTFVGEEYRLVSPSGTESFIDLLFFNRKMQNLIACELKCSRFKPEYAGKMNYYLGLLDDLVKESWENPSVGIILCTDRKTVDVEYALRDINKPIGVSGYKISKNLPEGMAGKLPEPQKLQEEILKEMDFVSEEESED
jgi:predicted nuclease of restriction endonuclease-like (RecB) superfamily